MVAQNWRESTSEPINYGRFINQFLPDAIKSTQWLKRINIKMCRQRMSVLFNQICITEEMLSKYTHTYIYIYTHPTPPHQQDMTEGQFLSGVKWVWNQSFPSPRLIAIPRLKSPVSSAYYFPIAEEIIFGCIPFLRVLVLCEMQTDSSRIWTLFTTFISYDYNHYTIYIYIYHIHT